MPSFAVQGSRTAATTTSPGNLTGGTSGRARLYEYELSNIGTVSTDAGFEVQLRRSTTAGTGTSFTPVALESGERAATSSFLSNLSAEPTYTAGATLDDQSVNPRNTFKWFANQSSDELVVPLTASNGIGFQCATVGGATTIVVSVKFRE